MPPEVRPETVGTLTQLDTGGDNWANVGPEFFEDRLKDEPGLKVLIRAASEVEHRHVANLLSICRHVGIQRANIAMRVDT